MLPWRKSQTIVSLFLLSLLFVSCDRGYRINKKLIKAEASFHKARFKEAVEHYESILSMAPPQEMRLKIYSHLGQLYSIYLQLWEKGIYYYGLIKSSSGSLDWQVHSEERIADIKFNHLRNYEGAIGHYVKLMSFYPKLPNYNKYLFGLATCYERLGSWPASEKILLSLLSAHGVKQTKDVLFALGKYYYKLGKNDIALRYIDQLLMTKGRDDKIDIQARYLKGNIYESQEALQKAYEIYYSLLGEYPNTSVLKSRLKSVFSRKVARKR